jgi:hypothetical protein
MDYDLWATIVVQVCNDGILNLSPVRRATKQLWVVVLKNVTPDSFNLFRYLILLAIGDRYCQRQSYYCECDASSTYSAWSLTSNILVSIARSRNSK